MDAGTSNTKHAGTSITKHGAVTGDVTFRLLALSVVACISGSFQFGYQLGVLTGPSDRIRNFYNESQVDRRDEPLSETASLWLWSTTVSVFCVGGALGALSSSYLADFLGRKGTMLFSNLISIFGALFMGLSYTINYYEMVIVGRFVIGLYGGLSITIVPLYLIEISPANRRGGIAIIHQVILNCGLLIAQILGIYAFDYNTGWPILLALTAVPSIIQLFILPFCPESPRLLFMKGKEVKCRQALMRLRGLDDVDEEMKELEEEAKEQRQSEKVGIWDVLMIRNPDWKKPLIISVCVHAGQQLTGINAILFYSTELYELTGLDDRQTGYAVVGIGVISIVTSIISIFLVDKFGRRNLLLYSVAVVTVSSTVLAFSISFQYRFDWLKWISLGMVYLFLVAFHFGAASIPFVIVHEIWSQGPRAAAMSISAQANWYSNFLVGLLFPYLKGELSHVTGNRLQLRIKYHALPARVSGKENRAAVDAHGCFQQWIWPMPSLAS
ncbi:solute carrier family 2, facilitated glucose transporter member 1-like isoform X2 [Apostichopus japonicus]|uniref:solute carrier family 2, facilitated glucose transporter member 1-like isoform X2 n=1 Tax=Stichopus japonicus TaxID=307972 RepID=UPI003AB6BBBF